MVEGRRVWCVGDTTEIGTYPAGASPYGVMDMAGNVREWVNDLYASNYYSFSPIHNPQGPATGSDHLLRGGSWDNHFDYMRVARRVVTFPERSNNLSGFRCARSLP
jgi:formylglycine-generating enzyme required for sulfatase activity